MNQEKIGNFIRSLRKEKKLTQKEIADKLNITDRAISRWERGIGCPDISLLEELSKILDVTILELLKGEHLEEKKVPTNINLIESINLGRKNILFKIKKTTNYFTTFLIVTFSLIIIITNIKSIILENKSYNYQKYLTERNNQLTSPPTIPINDLVDEVNTKIEKILSNQGIYKERDYTIIKTHLNVLKEHLNNQNNNQYLNKTNYSRDDLILFYIDHQNILTPLLDNNDLYSIIISYNPSLSDNLLLYSRKEDSIRELYFQFYDYLEQPYFIHSRLPYQGYTPNPFLIIEYIYNKELQLVNDLMKAGDIK